MQELPIYRGQRLLDERAGEQMAVEAITTVISINSALSCAAVKVLKKSLEQSNEMGFWGLWYSAYTCFWAGFLEGVRTQKQKNRQKKKPLDGGNIKRQVLKIPNDNGKAFNA